MKPEDQDLVKLFRERAEANAAPQPQDIPDLSSEQIYKMMHEVQVQRIELELQNEKLRRIMAELEQSRNQFSQLFHQAPIGYLVLDSIGLIHEVNETFCRMARSDRYQLIGKSFSECIEGEDRNTFSAYYQAFFNKPTGKYLETLILRSSAPAFSAHIEGSIITTPLGRWQVKNMPLLLIVVTDITERKQIEEKRLRLERQMQETQKLESLGVLAGGIAHDFNNLLAIIMGNASLALDELPQLSPIRSSMNTIEKTSLRAAELCRQMLAYSGKGQFIVEQFRLEELIEDMIPLLEASISKKAILHLNPTQSLPPLRGDSGQIRQIIMNMAINASEAIGDNSGVITLSTGTIECKKEHLNDSYLNETLTEGLYVWLAIGDTGCGMNQETLGRIFEPFFTTQFTGRGLGLSAVLGIVRGHKGALKVYSQVNEGTTFKVLFPAAQEEEQPIQPKNNTSSSEWMGIGTILLVDDEKSIRDIGQRMLERLGFSVLTAVDGCKALELYHIRHKEIALVLLDLTMPYMDGEETFRELRRIDPKVRVIMSSGYAESEITPRFEGKQLSGFLQKPYALYELAQCLREALDNKDI